MAVKVKRWRDWEKKDPTQFKSKEADLKLFDDGFRGGVLIHAEVPPQSEHMTSVNPCVRTYGSHEAYANCGSCKHLQKEVAREQAMRNGAPITVPLHVCPFRVGTSTPRITHEVNWPACSKYEGLK